MLKDNTITNITIENYENERNQQTNHQEIFIEMPQNFVYAKENFALY